MGNIIKPILIALIVIIAIVIIAGLFLPSEYSVSRPLLIDASPDAINEYSQCRRLFGRAYV